MHILILTDYFPPHLGGGVERVTSELATGLVRRGHRVSVLALRTCPAPRLESSGLLTIHRSPAIDLTRFAGVQVAVSLAVWADARKLIREFRPEVVHAHNLFFRTTETAAWLKRGPGVPLVTTLHLGRAEGGGRCLNLLVRAYEGTAGRYIIKRSDHLIAVSEAVADHARRIAGNGIPLTVIPNGGDAGLFHPRPGG